MNSVRKGLAALALLAGAAGGGYAWYRQPAGGEQRRAERPPPAVVLAPAQSSDITRTIEAVGSTVAAESVVVTAKAPGRIIRIEFKDGDRVAKDQVLIRLEQDEARAELDAQRAEQAEVEQQLARAEELLARGAGPRAPVEDARRRLQAATAQANAAQKRLEDTVVRAPLSGRVGLRNLSVGARVEATTELATVDTVDPIDLRFSVPERYLAQVKPGTRITAQSSAYPDRGFEGDVRAVASRVDPALRTVTVEARLPNPEGALVPGMLMNVSVALEVVPGAVVVPPAAVLVRGEEHFVYRVREGRAERAPVEIGQREPDRLQVVKGLKAGDEIAVEGLANIVDGRPVRAARRGEGEGGAPAPAGPEGAPAQARAGPPEPEATGALPGAGARAADAPRPAGN
ncbi:MAG TPA: efflux RND transporter periplasmic adaptor subunit [Microvirga sp.]|jgi:membrane fusion protein (multidrug efflux system)|nr:efflux RND transporter periplasmic adaptor subunit [Microvirga sp.]